MYFVLKEDVLWWLCVDLVCAKHLKDLFKPMGWACIQHYDYFEKTRPNVNNFVYRLSFSIAEFSVQNIFEGQWPFHFEHFQLTNSVNPPQNERK